MSFAVRLHGGTTYFGRTNYQMTSVSKFARYQSMRCVPCRKSLSLLLLSIVRGHYPGLSLISTPERTSRIVQPRGSDPSNTDVSSTLPIYALSWHTSWCHSSYIVYALMGKLEECRKTDRERKSVHQYIPAVMNHILAEGCMDVLLLKALQIGLKAHTMFLRIGRTPS